MQVVGRRKRETMMQGMERDALHKLETGAIPIGQDRSPFVIPMNPSREFPDLIFKVSFTKQFFFSVESSPVPSIPRRGGDLLNFELIISR